MSKAAELPSHYDSLTQDKKWVENWEKNQVYAYDPSKSRQETFVVDTPPPTVSGSLHMGHVFSYTQTDALVRFQRMQQKNIFYPMGWDDNGLPTERRVQNLYGVKCDPTVAYDSSFKAELVKDGDKKQRPISRQNFIELCGVQTKVDEKKYEALYRSRGISVDWKQQYETINSHCQKISQLSFLDLFSKKQVYSVEAPNMWDTTFQTAVAQAEVEDREQQGNFYDIKFAVENNAGEFVISTTRPELLAACIAVVAHPDDERYQKYFGKFALTPLFNARVPILPANHADPEKGTGILMICTFGDVNDVQWWKGSGLPLKQVIGRDGKWMPVTFGEAPFLSVNASEANAYYAGMVGLFAKQAKKKMAELLEANGFLIGQPRATQQIVKFYEKGDQPLEYVPTRQWFVHILSHKDKLLAQGEKIQWHPAHMKNKYDQWVEGVNQDWCISRQRYFGVPFPVWYPLDANGQPQYDEPIVASSADLPIDPMAKAPKGFSEGQRGKPNGFMGDPNVMDTWATSSMTPQISSHWQLDNVRHQKLFPADMRPQAHEIIRTWAFYTITKAMIHHNDVPWHHAAISGWVVDPEKKKMSKSKGNVVTPEQLIAEHSADAVRYWATRAKLGVDTLYDESIFKIGRRLTTKIFNASKFVLLQLEGVPAASLSLSKVCETVDLAILAEIQKHLVRVRESFLGFDYAQALMETESHFWDFCDYYVELVKGRAYRLRQESAGQSALATLDYCLQTYLQIFAPFLPFMTEEIWSCRYDGISPSIHRSSWPTEKALMNLKLEQVGPEFRRAKDFLALVRGEKTKAQKSLKWPVSKVEVTCDQECRAIFESMRGDLMMAANIEDGGLVYINGKVEGTTGFALNVSLSTIGPK